MHGSGALIDLVRVCYEVADLTEFGERGLPLLEQYFDASTSMLFRCDEQGMPIAIAGPLIECQEYYAKNLFAEDPIQPVIRKLNLPLLHGPSLPEWKKFSRHPAHTYCARYGFGNFVFLRLTDGGMYQPGMVGMLLARTQRQPDFSAAERGILGQLIPSLGASTKRSAGSPSCGQSLLDCLSDFGGSAKLIFDQRGNLLHVSPKAAHLLDMPRRNSEGLPEGLRAAARRMGGLLGRRRDPMFPFPSHPLPLPGRAALRADFHFFQASERTFIVAELVDPGAWPSIESLRTRYDLTRSEGQVLQLMAQGLADREIAKRLFVSRETIHTHARRLFDKLGVKSRLQAALLAHGKKVEPDSEVE